MSVPTSPRQPSQHDIAEPQQERKGDVSPPKSQAALDERLDHGIKESFPGSDPVSVEVSKYAPGDPRAKGAKSDDGETAAPDREGAISGLVEQVQAASAAVSKKASATLDELSERGAKVAPRLKDEFQRGREVVKDTVSAHPLSTAIVAGLIGCGIALIAYEAFSIAKQREPERRPRA